MAQLGGWRRLQPHFPILTWPDLVDMVRAQVNPLVGEEHVQEVVQQLQLMGEVSHVIAQGMGEASRPTMPQYSALVKYEDCMTSN